MRYPIRQTGIERVVVFIWLFSLCVFSVGCFLSTSRSLKDEKDKSADASEDSDAQSDAGDSEPPSSGSDSGLEQDTGSIKCRFDSECPSENFCQQGACSRSGFCSTVPLPDGEDCTGASAERRICLDGVCQISRCGDAFVDRNAGESCEDGNSDTGDGCVSCSIAFCGDGFIRRGDEDCDSLNDEYCNADCKRIVCGDGVIDEPIENCEPGISQDPCNDQCRISDSPEWTVMLQPELQIAMWAVLLLDSKGDPVVVATKSEALDPAPLDTHIYKYQNDGNQSWSVEVEHKAAITAALDNDDNIVVAGSTEEVQGLQPWIAKFDSDGEDLWSVSLSEQMREFFGVATDEEANIVALAVSPSYSSSFSLPPFRVIWLGGMASLAFISANGDYNSDSTTEIEGNYAFGHALNSDTIGGVGRYLVGGVVETEGSHESFLTLVDSKGEPIWDTPISYGVSDERTGFIQAVATSDGDIIALGISYSELTVSPFFGVLDSVFLWLQRYSPEGELRWDERKRVRIGDPFAMLWFGSFSIVPVAMAIDGRDNIYISAHNNGQNVINGFISIDKYDPDGEPAWTRPLHHESTSQQFPLGLAVDDSGAIYLLAADAEGQSDTTFPVSGFTTYRHILYKWEQPDY